MFRRLAYFQNQFGFRVISIDRLWMASFVATLGATALFKRGRLSFILEKTSRMQAFHEIRSAAGQLASC